MNFLQFLRIILESSNASSKLDPIPTSLVKLCCHELAPIIAEIINLSFSEGIVPNHWKTALVLPLLKKFGLDFMFENFRPISNLPFVVKSAEKATISQLSIHCAANAPFPEYQSAYRKNHSTETALLNVQNDILLLFNREFRRLAGLALSSSYSTWLGYLRLLINIFPMHMNFPLTFVRRQQWKLLKADLRPFFLKRHFIFKYNSKF